MTRPKREGTSHFRVFLNQPAQPIGAHQKGASWPGELSRQTNPSLGDGGSYKQMMFAVAFLNQIENNLYQTYIPKFNFRSIFGNFFRILIFIGLM
jgi:hypothetical protein